MQEDLEPKLFKAFMAVYETQNFTAAAKKCAMTQSGISQHIAKLETQIGTTLFKRTNTRIFATEAAQYLKNYIDEYIEHQAIFLDKIRSQEAQLTGTVRYAMPQSCLFTPHFSLLLAARNQSFPEVNLHLTIGPNETIFDLLLEDRIDFGFVTDKFDHAALKFVPFCKEEYILVTKHKTHLQDLDPEKIKQIPFIFYPGMEVYFSFWRRMFFPKATPLTDASLRVVGTASTIDGVISMLHSGMGMTVLPKQCVAQDIDDGTLYEYRSSSKKQQCLNQVYIVKLSSKQYPIRVQKVIETFLHLKK